MQITCDTHLHSNHSHDSEASLRDVCEMAISKGLKVVSTSEHVFLDPRDVGYGYFQLDAYLEEVKECAEVYEGRLKVLSGIEFSEPNLFPLQYEALCKRPIDSIVGSLHWLEKGFFGDPKGIALEMNTSTIRRDNQASAASYALVRAYLAMGGQRLTVGSDAHFLEDVAADFNQIPESFYPHIGYFEKRAFKKMDR